MYVDKASPTILRFVNLHAATATLSIHLQHAKYELTVTDEY